MRSDNYNFPTGKSKLRAYRWLLGWKWGFWNTIWTSAAAIVANVSIAFRWAVWQEAGVQQVHHHNQKGALDILYVAMRKVRHASVAANLSWPPELATGFIAISWLESTITNKVRRGQETWAARQLVNQPTVYPDQLPHYLKAKPKVLVITSHGTGKLCAGINLLISAGVHTENRPLLNKARWKQFMAGLCMCSWGHYDISSLQLRTWQPQIQIKVSNFN